jgi:hypothetical protein
MNAHRFQWLIAMFTLLCFLFVASTMPAEAQKKQKAKAQQKEQVKETTPKETVKEEKKAEDEEDAEKVEEATPPPPTPSAMFFPNKLIDVVKQYVGKKTNLGTLKKFAGDYMVFEDDLTTVLVPLSNIQSLRLVKDDESSPAQLEIKLIAKD